MKLLRIFFWTGWGLALSISLISWLDGRGIWGDLTTHFPMHFWGAYFICSLWFASQKKWIALALSLGLWGVYSVQLGPFYLQQAKRPAEIKLSLIAANIYRMNEDYDAIGTYLLESDADLILLTEVGPGQSEFLDARLASYPFRASAPLEGFFGMNLYSRLPIVAAEPVWLLAAPMVTLHARIGVDTDTLDFWGVHPPSPPRPQETHWRNQYFDRLGELLAIPGPHPRMVVGDFNLTPTNPRFRDFLSQTGLLDSRIGQGLLPTWPSGMIPLGIPLDHALLSPGLQADLQRGPDIGSDHLPMEYAIGWP